MNEYRKYPEGYYPPQITLDPEHDKTFNEDESDYILAERGAGKSTLAMEMSLLQRKMYPVVFVFTKTGNNNYWQQVVPHAKICDIERLSPDEIDVIFRGIIDMLVERGNKWRLRKAKDGRFEGNPYVLMIFEDAIGEGLLRKIKSVSELALNGRHKFASIRILSQDLIGLTPGERDNMDRWFIAEPSSPRILNAMRESWGNEIVEIARRVWKTPRRWLVIYNRKGAALEDRIGWYDCNPDGVKEMIHRNLCLGNSALWKASGMTVKEQKEKFPYIEKPSNATLAGQFNVVVKGPDEDEEGDGETDPVVEGEVEKKEDNKSDLTTWLMTPVKF